MNPLIYTNKEVVFKTREKSKFYYLSLSFYCKDKSETELYPLLLENVIRKYSGEMIIKTKNNKTYCDILLKKKKDKMHYKMDPVKRTR